MPIKVMPEDRVPLLKRLHKEGLIKLLYWDIETSPQLFYGWGTGETYLSYKQVKRNTETKIITIQYMWEGDSSPSYLEWDDNGETFDDSEMVEDFIVNVLRSVPAEELVVIGQNHKAFDHKILNERAKIQRLTPPVHNMIKFDTLKTSKQSFRTNSHSLDARSKQYFLGGKEQTDLSTWVDIMERRTKPKKILIPYGLKDVTDLRSVFWNDLPYIEQVPAPLEKIMLQAMAKCKVCEARKKPKVRSRRMQSHG
jgi:DNA polymerase elongation subunit (family B)